MFFTAGYFLLTALLLTESLVLAYVARGAVRAAVDHEARRSSPIGLLPDISVTDAPSGLANGGWQPVESEHKNSWTH